MKHLLLAQHNWIHIIVIAISILTTSFSDPERQYPQGYFQPPVGHVMELSGSFGELRANHFHAGIDISPAPKQTNEPIYAAADGYISRINITPGGYGQALYVTHPNGYTTVYGHLEKLTSPIDTFLRNRQYESESFEQNITLKPDEIPVRKGQQIGNMGNRGHSLGQHLHFEIRETATDKAINPLLFGFGVADNMSPTMNALKVYFINDKKEVVDTKIMGLIRRANGYGIVGDTIYAPSLSVAFSLKTYDKQDNKSGDNGIYSLDLKENNALIYKFKTEIIPFEESRYLNAHVDYYEHTHRGGFYHRAFRLPGNQLSIYENVVNDGIVNLGFEPKNIAFTVSDAAGNISNLSFIVKAKDSLIVSKSRSYTYLLPYNEPSIIKANGAKFFFPKGSFYNDAYFNFSQITEGGTYGTYSPTYQFVDDKIPLHYLMSVSILPINLPDSLRQKAFIAYCPRGSSKEYNCGGAWSEEGLLFAKNNQLGSYCIRIDEMPPSIRPLKFQYDMRKLSKMSFKIVLEAFYRVWLIRSY